MNLFCMSAMDLTNLTCIAWAVNDASFEISNTPFHSTPLNYFCHFLLKTFSNVYVRQDVLKFLDNNKNYFLFLILVPHKISIFCQVFY